MSHKLRLGAIIRIIRKGANTICLTYFVWGNRLGDIHVIINIIFQNFYKAEI
jgi:hypothetical protein